MPQINDSTIAAYRDNAVRNYFENFTESDFRTLAFFLVILPLTISAILLIGSREGWFGRGEKSQKLDKIIDKSFRGVVTLFGFAIPGHILVETIVMKENEFHYTCKFCKFKSQHNLKICPQCNKDDYGNQSDPCIYCKKPFNTNYNYCPHCGNRKLDK